MFPADQKMAAALKRDLERLAATAGIPVPQSNETIENWTNTMAGDFGSRLGRFGSYCKSTPPW